MSERPNIDIMRVSSYVAFRRPFNWRRDMLGGEWRVRPATQWFHLPTPAQEEVRARLVREADPIYSVNFSGSGILLAFDPGSCRWFERAPAGPIAARSWAKLRPQVAAYVSQPTMLEFNEFQVVANWGLKELIRQRILGLPLTIYPSQ